MSDLDLRMQYNEDSVFVFELDDGVRYEVVRWTTDELARTEGLVDTVEETRMMVQNSPRGLLQKLFGTVENWRSVRENRRLDD